MIPAFFFWLLFYGHGLGYIHLFIGCALWFSAAIVGRYYSAPNLLTALLISLPYILIMGNFLRAELSFEHNYSYYGTHWTREFFAIPALTFIAPPFFAYLGARYGSRRSAVSAVAAVVVFLLLAIGVVSMGPSMVYVESSEDTSFALAENVDIQIRAQIRCTYRKQKHYWEFRDLSQGECIRTVLTVAGRNSEPSLPTKIDWTIDGVEQSQPISLSFAPEDLSLPFPPGFDSITRWRTGLPFEDMRYAKDVKFQWGSEPIDFAAPDANHLKELNEVLSRLANE